MNLKSLFLSVCAFAGVQFVSGQVTLYDKLHPGEYGIGYTDTLITDSRFHYTAYGYDGPKPLFIKIWHPQKTKENTRFLCTSDLFEIHNEGNLKSVCNALNTHHRAILIQDFIAENQETGEPNSFGNLTYDSIASLTGNLTTRSVRAPISSSTDFPVIIYHHGALSHPAENYIMAEYFASKGFMFIAANFHLPYEDTQFGSRPYSQWAVNEDEESLRSLLAFARSISRNPHIFFIGHSMGAQMGFRAFGEENSISGMVSLETTIEFKQQDDQVLEYWPEIYREIAVKKVNYPYPIMLCAATGKEAPFFFLDRIQSPQLVFVSTNVEFEHNAYLSWFYLRNFLDPNIPQPDKRLIGTRLPVYFSHLRQINIFLNGILKGQTTSGNTTLFIKE